MADNEEDQEQIDAAEDAILREEAAKLNAGESLQEGDGNGEQAQPPLSSALQNAKEGAVTYFDETEGGGAQGVTSESAPEPQYEGPEQPYDDQVAEINAGIQDEKKIPSTHLKSVGDAAEGGGYVSGTGMRLADDRSWEKQYNAMLKRRAATRAGRQAAADEREALLASGKYFDDGRGNIKLKKEFREYQRVGNGGRRTYNETISDTGTAARAMNRAAKTAYDASKNGWQQALDEQKRGKRNASLEKTRAMVAASKAEMEDIKRRKEEQKANRAKGMLSIYDGLVAAYSDLIDENNKNRLVDEEVPDGPRQFKRDAQGMVTTEMLPQAMRKTGRTFRNGHVPPRTIEAINANLAQRGIRNFKISGIIAQQQTDRDLGDKGDPKFLVEGWRWNDQGQKETFGKYMTMQDVYRMGVENGIASGMDATEAEWNVANGFKDVFGRLEGGRLTANSKLDVEKYRQDNMNKRAEMRQDQFDEKIELERQKLDEQIQKRIASAKTEEEKNKALQEWRAARLKLMQDQLDLETAKFAADKGRGETREAGQKKIKEALDKPPTEQPKPTGDNGADEQSESTEYPGYSNGKAKRALAAGWTWNKDTKRFEPPRK